MKKVLSVILSVTLLLSVFTALPFTASAAALDEAAQPVGAQSGKAGDNCTWKLENGVLTISGKGKMYNYSSETIYISGSSYIKTTAPWRYSITSAIIKDGVTSIGDYAFYGCTGLTSVTIGNSVTSIGDYAFNTCTGLTSVTIPDSVTTIDWCAFRGCTGLTSVTIPDSVTSIGYDVFSYCTGLTSVTIPDSVTSIGSEAFYGCTGLTSVTIPDSVTSIGDRALGYYYKNGGYFEKVSGFTILGIKGSRAEGYAKDNGFKFIVGEKICPHCHSLLSAEQVITFAATCTEDGERYWQCDQCGEMGEDVLPALGHDYIAVITKPTCTKGGYTTYTCSRCKDTYVSEVAALGHNYQAVVTAPTCTKGGYTTHTCSHCKDAYVTDEVAALGHDYHRADVVPPNCTEQGYTPYTCSRCSEIKKEDIVDALGHDWNITVKRQPTETQQGVMAVDCQRCNLKKNVLLPVLSDQDYTLTTSAEPGKVTYTLKDKTYGVFETVADAPEGWFADGTTGDCTWEKKGDQLIISGNGKMENYTDSNPAPWKNLGITKVIIDQGVTSIGDYAFLYCNSTSVTIPDSVTSIGVKALGYYYNYGYKKVSGFTIYGSPGSEAERYANDNGFTFIEYVDATIGDMTGDGKVNVRDVTAMQRHLAGLEELTDDRLALADTNGDGKVDINDATLLQMYLAEYDNITFPTV